MSSPDLPTKFHHILTTPYLGTHDYRFSWHNVRPTWATDILRNPDKKWAP